MREPCPLPLVALAARETCPRCGRPAREHRGHPNYEETTMDETTEPTREQIVEWLATHFAPASIDDERAVLRLALRTLDAEAQLESCMQVEACSRAFNDLAIRERDTARAKLAEVERERDEEGRLRTEWGALYTDMVRQRDDWHEAAHAADERAAVSSELREAAEAERDALRTKLADAERRIAELSPPTVPTTDERLDCEASSLLLLLMWARWVMMRPKNRAKDVPSESIRTLLWMARDELFEAYSAIEEDAPTDYILAELGDAAAIIGFAMREIEKRRKA